VVSETELLAAWSRRVARIAGELMIAPVTIRPDATISAATRVMTAHDATSLPVTGADRQLIGIVSRRDGVVDVVNRATGGEGPRRTGKSAPG
jgi:CBS domain-containing protein